MYAIILNQEIIMLSFSFISNEKVIGISGCLHNGYL